MACLQSTLMILYVICSLCGGVPIKPKSPEEGATDECYGTQCYYYDTDYTDTNVKVTFPENFTDAILLALPNIQGSQDEMVTFLNKTLISQDKEADHLQQSQNEMISLLNKTLISQEKTEDLLELMKESMDTGLLGINHQIKNMTATMTDLTGNIANLLQNQLDVLRFGLSPTRDCQDIAANYRSGPYVITPADGLGSFEAYCDIADNEGWTVIQKRFDGSVDFYQTWTPYEEGFGDASGEYWLGLKNIRRLTSDGTWALKIDLKSFDGETAYAVYDSFGMSDAASNYRLSVGEFRGNAGDSLKYTGFSGTGMHNGMAFSTYDRDNDRFSGNCASINKAGWWNNACHRANLNGLYNAMIWYTWKNNQSVKSSQMKIRRVH